MIAYSYGKTYDGRGSYPTTPYRIQSNLDGAVYVKYQVNLLVTAAKYQVQVLYDRITTVFPTMLHRLLSNEGYHEFVESVARHIYQTHPEAASKLKPVVTDFINEYVEQFQGDTRFKELLRDVPELAMDLLESLAESKKWLKQDLADVDGFGSVADASLGSLRGTP